MKHYTFYRTAVVAVVLFSVTWLQGAAQSAAQSSAAYIDPTIGNVGHLLEPTRPTAHLPNQPVRVYPIRKDYLDEEIT